MQKRFFYLDIIRLIVQAASILLLFLPGMYAWEHWEAGSAGVWTLKMRIPASYFHAGGNVNGLLAYLVFFIIVANVVVTLISVFTHRKIGKALGTVIPILSLLAFLAFSFYMGVRDDYGYCAPVKGLFYVEVFLLLANVVIHFLALSKTVQTKLNDNEKISTGGRT